MTNSRWLAVVLSIAVLCAAIGALSVEDETKPPRQVVESYASTEIEELAPAEGVEAANGVGISFQPPLQQGEEIKVTWLIGGVDRQVAALPSAARMNHIDLPYPPESPESLALARDGFATARIDRPADGGRYSIAFVRCGSVVVCVESTTGAYDPETAIVRLECNGLRYSPAAQHGGKFSFDNLSPGRYQVDLDPGGSGFVTFGYLPVNAGQPSRFGVDLRGQADIAGRILMHGRPLADSSALTVKMTEAHLELAEPQYLLSVDTEGSFQGLVRRGEYSVTVVRGEQLVGSFVWAVSAKEETREFDLAESFRISGRILDPHGQVLPNVELVFAEPREGGGVHNCRSDDSGEFRALLPAGVRHSVQVRGSSFGGMTLGTITLTEDTTIDFEIPGGSKVHGRITSANGEPLPGVLIVLMNWRVRTGDSGQFEIADVPAGRFQVYAYKQPGNILINSSDLTVVGGEDLWLELVEDLPQAGFVAGKVVSADGKPISGIRVQAAGVASGLAGCITKRDGKFKFKVHGEVVDVWANGPEEKGLCRAEAKVSLGTQDIVLVLRAPVELDFVFMLNQQRYLGPIHGHLELKDESGRYTMLGLGTSARAMRRFRRIPAGCYRMMFQFTEGFASTEWVDVDLREGQLSEVQVELVAGSAPTLDFDSPFSGRFAVRSGDGQIVYAWDRVNATSSIRVGRIVPAGSYEVLAFSRYGEVAVGQLEVLADHSKPVSWEVFRCGIRIKVMDAAGNPVAGRRVRVCAAEHSRDVPLGIAVGKLQMGSVLTEREAVTDDGGRCSFAGLLPASYVLTGHGGEAVTVTVGEGDASHAEVLLTCE